MILNIIFALNCKKIWLWQYFVITLINSSIVLINVNYLVYFVMLSKKFDLCFRSFHTPQKKPVLFTKINYIRVPCDNLNFIVLFSYNDGDDDAIN